MIYISNLLFGLESGLDEPEALLQAVKPFNGKVGIEFFLHYHHEAYRRKMADVPKWLADLPRAMHGPFIQADATCVKGTPEYEHLMDAWRWAFETAKALGCTEMVFHTHGRVIMPEEKVQAQQAAIANLEVLIEMGASYGISLLIENLGIQRTGVSLFDEEDFIALVKRFPAAGCLIDTGHLHVAGWDTAHVLSTLGGRIKGYHLHNNDGAHDSHLPIHEGSFNYTAFYKLYRRYTPDAFLTLEYNGGSSVTPALLKEDINEIMRELQS